MRSMAVKATGGTLMPEPTRGWLFERVYSPLTAGLLQPYTA